MITHTEIVEGQLWRVIVHRPNTCFLKSISGNAGLFSTALDISVLAKLFLNQGKYGKVKILSPEAVKEMTRNRTENLNESRGWVGI